MQVSRPYITKVLHQDVNITFPNGGEARQRPEDGLLPGATSAGAAGVNPEVTKYGIICA